MIEFEDVLARHLDLGCFMAIKHRIDTGDSKLIKQQMRRTPLGFEGGRTEATGIYVGSRGYLTLNFGVGFSSDSSQEKRWRNSLVY